MSADILIVDDEADIRELVAGILDDEGHRCRVAANSDEALGAIEARRPQLVFLDIWIQGSRLDGLQLLDIIKEQHPDLPVVMISGHGNVETAVSAIKRGAYDFIEKPFKADRLVLVAERALEASRLKREVKELRVKSQQASRIVGHSQAANQLRQTIERVAATNARVMIAGAPGSGKELAARTIHSLSNRATGPFVAINAATITPETMETELFGVEGGEGRTRKVGGARGGPWRHSLSRRGRRHAARDAGQDPARAGRAELPARRRDDARPCRRPRDLIDGPGSPRRDRGGPVPRGSAASPQRRADQAAEPGRTSRGHPRADHLLHGPDLGFHGPAQAHHRRGRARRAAVPRLAGQYPPAAQQHRAPADPGGGAILPPRSRRTCCRPRSDRSCRPPPTGQAASG